MKKNIMVIVFISLSILGMSTGNHEYSKWIPRDALEAAKQYWVSLYEDRNDESIKHQFGLSGRKKITM